MKNLILALVLMLPVVLQANCIDEHKALIDVLKCMEVKQNTQQQAIQKLKQENAQLKQQVNNLQKTHQTLTQKYANLEKKIEIIETQGVQYAKKAGVAEMLKARNHSHFLRFHYVDDGNHDVFELWRSDNTWHKTIKVESASRIK